MLAPASEHKLEAQGRGEPFAGSGAAGAAGAAGASDVGDWNSACWCEFRVGVEGLDGVAVASVAHATSAARESWRRIWLRGCTEDQESLEVVQDKEWRLVSPRKYEKSKKTCGKIAGRNPPRV